MIRDICAMSAVTIASWARMNADVLPLFSGEVREDFVIEIDESVEQVRVLGSHSSICEVDADSFGSGRETATNVLDAFQYQIFDEVFLGIGLDRIVGRVDHVHH